MNKTMISEALGLEVLQLLPLSGGDISEAYCIEHTKGKVFIKTSKNSIANAMFRTECLDLNYLSEEGGLNVPKELECGNFQDGNSYLIMDYVDTRRITDKGWQKAGRMLADMHKSSTANVYGLDHDNFIGSLTQSNIQDSDLYAFYSQCRLHPQIKLAQDNDLLSDKEVQLLEDLALKIKDIIPVERPTLIHGDLWSGNLIGSKDGGIFFIDPSISYLHREMDIAMSCLFGGFAPSFYDAYNEVLAPEKGWERRMDIFQLYYLLVHLNLFGLSYKDAVINIATKYK